MDCVPRCGSCMFIVDLKKMTLCDQAQTLPEQGTMDQAYAQQGRHDVGSSGSHPWQTFLYFIFPIPMIFLVLLALPLPKHMRERIRRAILWVLDHIALFKIELGGASVTLIAIIIIVAGLGFIFSVREVKQYKDQESMAIMYLEKKEIRCKRWRSERNLWISLMGLLLWLVLALFRSLILENQDLSTGASLKAKDELIKAQGDTIRELQVKSVKVEKELADAKAQAKRNS